MVESWQPATITRLGVALAGSPFLVKLRYRRLHVDPQIAPVAARRPVQEFLIFADISAEVAVGDIVALADGETIKIIDVRSYPMSLQCMLQRLPYLSAQVFVPVAPSGVIAADKSLPDVRYTPAGTVLLLLEPHGADQGPAFSAGLLDRRTCWIFSVSPLTIQSVIVVNGEYWLTTAASSYWASTNDYRSPARRLAAAPLGV